MPEHQNCYDGACEALCSCGHTCGAHDSAPPAKCFVGACGCRGYRDGDESTEHRGEIF